MGAPSKIEVKEGNTGYKLDGDDGTKFIRLTLSEKLQAGDFISVTMYATSSPNGSDYGIQLGNVKEETEGEDATTTRVFEGITTLYITPKVKNTLDTQGYTVNEDDGIAGTDEVCMFRATGKSTYFNSVTITRDVSNGIRTITTVPTDENAPVYNLAGQQVSKDMKGILIRNGRKSVNK